MKRMLSSLALALAILGARAQDSAPDELLLKPSKGTLSTEVNINPFTGGLKLNNALNQVKARYFIAENQALRLGFHISSVDTTSNINNPYGNNSYFAKSDQKSTTWSINAGYEYHLKGTRRISPYVGADLTFGSRSASEESSSTNGSTTVEDGWLQRIGTQGFAPDQHAYTRYGASILTGFDFYISRAFYFGYELNLTFHQTRYKNVAATIRDNSTPVTTINFGERKAFRAETVLFNGIRLGYNF